MDARPLSRRDFLRLSALLAGGVTLLSACSGSQPAPAATLRLLPLALETTDALEGEME